LSWAERAAEKDDDKPAIIEAKLNVKKLVDLSDRGHWHSVRQVYDLMAEDDLLPLDQEGPEVLFTDDETYSSQTWKHLTDHAVMDWYLEGLNATLLANGEELDAVRCPFVGGRQIYENSWFFHRSCNMIAVKNGRSVVDLFIHQT